MRYLIHAGNEFVGDMIRERLGEAGIESVFKKGSVRMMGTLAEGGDIYVEDGELERARRVLKEAGHVSEDELEELSEESPPPPD